MRYLTLNINPNTRIDIDNSIWGKETIKYNDEIVSEKSSFWGQFITLKSPKMEN
ncbi:hypothetical protein [Emticicia sp. W12TSBA100-4]|uniref:hypothetical protein n=1 Tax=Emticicia sp. W12TSBA100-4 TaxID=3160965 RepID=UPI00330632D1